MLQELEFDKTVEAIRALERVLDPVVHSVVLLEREKEKEERELEREYKTLKALEANARAQRQGWRERGRREHVLVPVAQGKGDGHTGEGELEVVKREERGGTGVFKARLFSLFSSCCCFMVRSDTD